ncbi:YhgE/Pip domain-containing protein [Brevibacillus ginsengisoli]|uniref:YhgE/Pip domain-containing protein n=1 Tax=Brevibacillus ginsengisoli TaxID=363854 RepID=UPI003CF94372
MKTIRQIYTRDMKNIVTNWVASVVILGLVFLPSLYAWFNIESSWDPYGRTSGLPIAVANNDQGAVIGGKHLNIGNEIIASLRENHNIGWVFTDEAQAFHGVQHGNYYASITIPADFSAKIATVLTKSPQKAEILYDVNEKINAVSPKISAAGASGIIEEVNRNFIKTANGAIFQIFNEIGIALQSDLPTIMKVRDMIFKLETMIPTINQAVAIGSQDIHKTNEIIQRAQADLPTIAKLATDGQDFSNHLGLLLDHSSAILDTVAPNVKQDLLLLQQATIIMKQITDMLQDPLIDPNLVKTQLDRIANRLATAAQVTQDLSVLFDRLNQLTGGSGHTNLTDKLLQITSNLQQQASTVTRIREALDRGEKPAAELITRLNQLSQESSAFIGDILGRYDREIVPKIQQGVEKAKKTTNDAKAILADVTKSIPDVEKILQDVATGLALGNQELLTLQKELPLFETKLVALANRIRDFEKKGNINEIIDLLQNNVAKRSEFFAEPVVLKEHKLFPIPNYGSAMSPFFTTLSLWVGALLLVSLLSVEVHHPNTEYKSYEIYFGRFLTFLTLALLQSLMVTMGDIFILGTYVVNKLWFVLFGLVLSGVFMLIVYTLVSVFGNVGKAMAIVLLVLQLAGSGGTFPIQVTPPFFQAIHPYLPFTYGISMMREAVGGILRDIVSRDLLMMAVFVGIFLVIGLALKKRINRSTAHLVVKAKESKLIH